MLTLHGRTREQRFSGTADWNAIAAVKAALNIPVIANGDVNSPEEALRCLRITGADGLMVGRGSMGAPWLVGQIDAALSDRPIPATPAPRARLALAKEQLQALIEARGGSLWRDTSTVQLGEIGEVELFSVKTPDGSIMQFFEE